MHDQSIPLGLCQCGCGQKTTVSPRNHTIFGYVKGQPRRFVKGHQNALRGPEYVENSATGCWEWQHRISDHGYGLMRNDGGYAHRAYYARHVGPIPEGLVIDHLCRNRACVNPAHMEPVSNAENVLRGFSPPAVKARAKHCPKGHPLSGENLYVSPSGKRGCRECRHAAARRAWDADKARYAVARENGWDGNYKQWVSDGRPLSEAA